MASGRRGGGVVAQRSGTSGGRGPQRHGVSGGTPTAWSAARAAVAEAGRARGSTAVSRPSNEPNGPAGGAAPRRSRQQLCGDHARGVQVLARVGRRAGRLLGGHVAAGAHRAGDPREAFVPGDRGDPEVAEPEPGTAGPGRLEEQVARLDVAVHHAGSVHGDQRFEGLLQQHPDVGLGQRPVPAQQVGDAAATDQVHGEQGVPAQLGPARVGCTTCRCRTRRSCSRRKRSSDPAS